MGGLRVHAGDERAFSALLAGPGGRRLSAAHEPGRGRVLPRADPDTGRGGHVPAGSRRGRAPGPVRRRVLASGGAVGHATGADGNVSRRPVPGGAGPRRRGGDAVLSRPAAGGTPVYGRGRAL